MIGHRDDPRVRVALGDGHEQRCAAGARTADAPQSTWRRNPQTGQTALWPPRSITRKLAHPLVLQNRRLEWVGRRRRRRMEAARPMVEV